jgi:hypothetical protein
MKQPGNPYWVRLSAIDLLVKIGCFIKNKKIEFKYEKQLI